MRWGRWISCAAALAVAGGLSAGCASDEPRELGRSPDGALPEQQAEQQPSQERGGYRAGGEEKIDSAATSHVLDGRSFSVQLRGPEGEPKQDDLMFRDGRFDSIACHEYGFSSAPYTAMEGPDGAITFRSITTSGESKMRWNGTVKGDSIEGTAVVLEPGKDPVYYSYSSQIAEGDAK